MKRVRRHGTNAELILEQLLKKARLTYKAQVATLPGRPDFVLRKAKIAIFVDGDFWHGRHWFDRQEAPHRNRSFWIEKFERNHRRDGTADARLRRAGWSVLRLWEKDLLKHPGDSWNSISKRIRARRRKV